MKASDIGIVNELITELVTNREHRRVIRNPETGKDVGARLTCCLHFEGVRFDYSDAMRKEVLDVIHLALHQRAGKIIEELGKLGVSYDDAHDQAVAQAARFTHDGFPYADPGTPGNFAAAKPSGGDAKE